uniref:hypothetical protein n=1 Tax=Escherichia coli TaxID=562 RepID=UPI003132DE6D
EMNQPDYKGIYAFDLNSKKLVTTPVYKINLTDPAFKSSKTKKIQSVMQPSDINIHPVSGEIYVLEATNPKLLILNNAGRIKKLYHLNPKTFAQPEGLSFASNGDLYISNEGKNGRGNIVKVTIQK